MIVLDKPEITDLFIPRSGGSDCCIKKGVFGRKDIETILAGYVTKEEFAAEIARLEQMIENLNQ